MTTPTIEPTRAIPVRFGTPQAFDRLRDFLLRAGFMEPTICSRMGIATIYDFRQLHEGRERTELGDALDVLVRLFLDGEVVDGAAATSHLGADGVALLEQFGLVAESTRIPGGYHATVALYPTRGLLIASDLGRKAAGSSGELAQDVVYPAVTSNTQVFLDAVSFDPCELGS